MTLNEWLEDKGWSDMQAAKYFGISRPVINRIKNGVRSPTFDHAFRIWIGTNGRVGFMGWASQEHADELACEIKGRK